jgi:hypothetical protein
MHYSCFKNKGAFVAPEQPQTNNRSALQYWLDEMCTKAEGTRKYYLKYFNDLLAFANMTADELLAQRIQDAAAQTRRYRREWKPI